MLSPIITPGVFPPAVLPTALPLKTTQVVAATRVTMSPQIKIAPSLMHVVTDVTVAIFGKSHFNAPKQTQVIWRNVGF